MSEAEKKRELSSAKSRVRLKRFSVISLTYTKNNKGPKTEPCGTPADTLRILEEAELICTFCFLDER